MNKLRTVELYRDEQRKILAIEAVELNKSQFKNGGQLYGWITPLVLIVCSSDGKKVLTVDADNRLDKLKALHAKLDEVITQACRSDVNA